MQQREETNRHNVTTLHWYLLIWSSRNKYYVFCRFRSGGRAHETTEKRAVVNLAVQIARGCDSAVGGTLPQLGVESPVSAETEGEFGRERDPGCTSENGVSIIRWYFPVSGRNNASAKEGFAPGVPDVARVEAANGRLYVVFFFFSFFLLSRVYTYQRGPGTGGWVPLGG